MPETGEEYPLVVAAHRLPVNVRDNGPGCHGGAGATTDVLVAATAVRGGAWVGCGSTASLPPAARYPVPRCPVPLTTRECEDFHGHCTGTLAPLYFDYPQTHYRRAWQDGYRQVNQRFAATAARIAAPNAAVWVHDYHLQLMPGYLRRIRPDVRIGFFLHSPFPPPERFLQQPMRSLILASLHDADLVGFQHARSARNFLDVSAGLPQHRVRSRTTYVDVFPASVDAPRIAGLAARCDVRARAAAIRARLDNPRVVLLSLGAFDPAEGVERRLDAYARLLTDHRLDPHDTVLVHVATGPEGPSHHRDHIDRQVARINGVFSRLAHPVIHYLRQDLDLPELVALYTAADLLLALPLHHGTVLAAKEFVAARVNDTGRLVLSEFTAAANELPEADLVNPYDVDAVTDAIAAAAADCDGTSSVMRRMRQRLDEYDGERWVTDFLTTLDGAAGPAPADLALLTQP